MCSTVRLRHCRTIWNGAQSIRETLFWPLSVSSFTCLLELTTDEAHRASGSYAYNTVIARITAVSPYFRVLALTATPGNKVEKVQGVVDGLHISRIEIREAESPEVTQYTNEKKVELHTIPIDGVIRDTMKRWADLMRPQIKKMVDKGIFERDIDPFRLRAFTVQARTMEMASKPQFKWIWGPMGQIRHMAQAMGHLVRSDTLGSSQRLTDT